MKATSLFYGCVGAILGNVSLAQPVTLASPAPQQTTAHQPAPATVPTTQPGEASAGYAMPEAQPMARGGALTIAQPAPTVVEPADVAQIYSCVIRLDADIEPVGTYTTNSNVYTVHMTPGDSQTAVALLTSTALMDPAAEKSLGLSAEKRRSLLVVNSTTAGPKMARLEVILRKSTGATYAAGSANKLADALLANLRAAYAQSAEVTRKAAQLRRESAEKELDAARKHLEEVRLKDREIRTLTLSVTQNSGTDTLYVLNNLRVQKRNYEQQLAGFRQRLAPLEARSAPLVKEWTSIVKLREQQLSDAKAAQTKGAAADPKIVELEAQVAEAKVQLVQAQQTAANDANSSSRTTETSLRSQIADTEERLRQTTEQIAKMEDPKFVAMLEQLPELQQEMFRLRNLISEQTVRTEQARRSGAAEGVVTVTVLDGKQP